MKEILVIGGPDNLQGVDQVNDDLVSILEIEGLYKRKWVVLWPTEKFLASPPADSNFEAILKRPGLMNDMFLFQYSKQLSTLSEEAKRKPIFWNRFNELWLIQIAIYRLAKLQIAMVGGQNLVFIPNALHSTILFVGGRQYFTV
jgi:hypothetical protein